MSASQEDDWLEIGRKLFAKECSFIIGATEVAHLPATALPEFAFIGRSNVGKSSLINALTNRKNLARTSNTPGRTQQLNFFTLNDQLMLVDLPGYGHAQASKKDIEGWNALMRDYLRGRRELRRAMVLIDSRHGLKPNDLEMMRFLNDLAVPYQLVLTKTDKMKPSEKAFLESTLQAALRLHPAALNEVAFTSSEKNEGIAELRALLAQVASY